MSDQEPGGVFIPSEDQDSDDNRLTGSRGIINYDIPLISDQLSLWLQNAPTSSSISMEEAHEAARYTNILKDLSRFEVPSSLPLQQCDQIPCSEDIILHGLEKGQSGDAKRKLASDTLEMQTKESDEDGAKEDPETTDEWKQRNRTRSTEVHNLHERLRRQKLKQKMKALQELIPNCNKRDKASILDDAIKYMKTLQYQVQMMSMGAGFSMFHSPMMMPQPGQQGMQIPSLPPFLHTCPRGELKWDMGWEWEWEFPAQLGLHNPCLLASATSGLPAPGGISAAHSIQNPGNVLEPLYSTTSSMDWAPWYATSFPSSGSQCTTQVGSNPSQGAPSSKKGSCPIPRGSTARVLPSQIILPHVIEEVKDYGSSNSFLA
ncbi:hypothetical protein Pfo_010697 [Paulownia fortunei]|nr:hypothetical protein Pfo_010697 [Paulownia fortunei]